MSVDLSRGLGGLCGVPLDPYAPFSAVRACNPVPQPGVLLFREWILRRAGGRDLGIVRSCGLGSSSKHHEGRAWDWAPPSPRVGTAVWDQLLHDQEALARRAGLRTIIWGFDPKDPEPTIWLAGHDPRPYLKSNKHTDHVHFGFGWPGAVGETSLYAALEEPDDPDRDYEEWGKVGVEMSLASLPGLADSSPQFRRALATTALDLSLDPDRLAAVICFETAGTWQASKRNPLSGAVGLIQWTRPTARAVHGLSLRELAEMSSVAQLRLVGDYLRRVGVPPGASLQDVYLAVFAPAFVGTAPDRPIYRAPTKAYAQNQALDRDQDGLITAAEAAAGPARLLADAHGIARIKVVL